MARFSENFFVAALTSLRAVSSISRGELVTPCTMRSSTHWRRCS